VVLLELKQDIQDRQALLKAKYCPRARVAADAHRKHQKTHVTLTLDLEI